MVEVVNGMRGEGESIARFLSLLEALVILF